MTERTHQREALQRVVDEIARRRLCSPAIFALESTMPLSFLASQALVVLGPIVKAILPVADYDVFCEALEDRRNVEWLIQALDEAESAAAGDHNATGE